MRSVITATALVPLSPDRVIGVPFMRNVPVIPVPGALVPTTTGWLAFHSGEPSLTHWPGSINDSLAIVPPADLYQYVISSPDNATTA